MDKSECSQIKITTNKQLTLSKHIWHVWPYLFDRQQWDTFRVGTALVMDLVLCLFDSKNPLSCLGPLIQVNRKGIGESRSVSPGCLFVEFEAATDSHTYRPFAHFHRQMNVWLKVSGLSLVSTNLKKYHTKLNEFFLSCNDNQRMTGQLLHNFFLKLATTTNQPFLYW